MLSGLMCREGCPGILLPKHSNILGKFILVCFTHGSNFTSGIILNRVFAKKKEGTGLRILNLILIATNFTSICCVYKEKIVKNNSYRRT